MAEKRATEPTKTSRVRLNWENLLEQWVDADMQAMHSHKERKKGKPNTTQYKGKKI